MYPYLIELRIFAKVSAPWLCSLGYTALNLYHGIGSVVLQKIHLKMNFLTGKPTVEGLDIDGRTILKWISKK